MELVAFKTSPIPAVLFICPHQNWFLFIISSFIFAFYISLLWFSSFSCAIGTFFISWLTNPALAFMNNLLYGTKHSCFWSTSLYFCYLLIYWINIFCLSKKHLQFQYITNTLLSHLPSRILIYPLLNQLYFLNLSLYIFSHCSLNAKNTL